MMALNSEHCRGSCGECDAYAKENGLLFATFRCSSCGQLVGWCEGGTPTDADPNGDRCAECFCAYDAALGEYD